MAFCDLSLQTIYNKYLCFSDKSKRRTKTVKKSLEPKWNQTFLYSHVHRRDFRERMLEITVWDQPRVQEEESEFLGEVIHTITFLLSLLFGFEYICIYILYMCLCVCALKVKLKLDNFPTRFL